MYLKKVEIKGFKSFADKVELDLEKGITGVVGPNGSGKSNISDAVRWVLGEQSAKSLRGEKMEDIIFAGTDKRKPLGFAEVSITIDNTDGMLPIEYSEVTVTRRMYRSGESEYYINNNSCRLKDITETFMDTGVGKEGYSIIGQGRIEEIINARPEDRRELFEEAAGIVKYKTRKLESEKKLENTEQNIVRINDIVGELEAQIEPLSEESARARKYLNLRESLKSLELNLFVINTDRIKEKLSALNEDSANLESQLHDNNWKISKLEENYTALKGRIQELDIRIKDSQDAIYSAGSDTQKLIGDLNVLNEKKNNAEKEIGEIENLIENQKQSLDELHKSIQKQTELLNITKQTIEEKNALLLSKSGELKYINDSIDEKDRNIEDMKSEIIELLNQISEKKSSINSCKTFISGIERRKNQIDREKAQNLDKINVIEEDIKNLITEIDGCSEKIKGLENRYRQIEEEKKNLTDESTAIEREIYELNGRIQSGQGRCRVLHEMENDFEGYNRSVREIMKYRSGDSTMNSGVCGVIAELIKVPEKYEVAIEVAMGGALQNIVTNDEYSAKYCIEFLKKYKYGRATFLPLTTVKAKHGAQIPGWIQSMGGFVGMADSLVEYDKKYAGIISNLLGRVIVADNMDSAIVFAKKTNYTMRIVTLDGDIINPGGAFTGGSVSSKAVGILSRKREIEEIEAELKKQNEVLSNLRSKKAAHESLIRDCEEKLRSIGEQKNSLQVYLSSKSSQCSSRKAEEKGLNDTVKNLKLELSQLMSEYSDASKRIDDDSAELMDMNRRSSELSERVESEQSSISGILSRKDEIVSTITSLKVEIAECKQNQMSLQAKIDGLNNDISSINLQINDNKAHKGKLQEEIQDVQDEMGHIEGSINELKVKAGDMKDQLEQMNKQRAADYSSLEDMEGKKKEYSETSTILQGEIHKLEMQKAKLDMELKNLQDKIWEDYETSYASALKYKTAIESFPKAAKEIERLKESLKEMGPVNINAIEEYKKVKERYEFILKQKKDLEEAKDSLKSVISEMIEEMKSQFSRNFMVINNNFNAYFQQLFGGGRSEVVLTDEADVLSCGIEIIAQPPGKKLQSLTLLSGGEKALTAIALLFAILKMKPSPFCILDEIEAALDDVNINRFAKFLRELSRETQFIVVTHRKGTMEAVDTLYGVTMEEKGISRLVSAKLSEKAS